MNKLPPSYPVLNQTNAVSGSQYTRATGLCLAFLIATLWLTTRPYLGVIHDSRFYTIEALNELISGRFSDDLYFRYGSQGQFTLFTQMYKPFLAAFGIANGNLILTIIAQFIWLTGLLYITRTLFQDRKIVPVAISAAILLPGGIFLHYGEAFLTPRLFAEAITFWALGLMLRGRPIRALLLLCVSITIHPLNTLPGLAVLFLHEALRRPALWVAGGLAVIGTLALAFFGVQPFARFLASFDPEWFAIVRVRDGFCFITQLGISEWIRFCNMLVLVVFGLVMAKPNERRFLGTVLAVGVGGPTLSLIGGDFFRNVLIVDIQAWRATWLLALVAHLFVAPIFFRIQRRENYPFANADDHLCTSYRVARFVEFLCTGLSRSGTLVATIMMVVAGIVGSWEKLNNRAIPFTARVIVTLFVGSALGLAVILLYLSFNIIIPARPDVDMFRHPMYAIAMTVIASAAIGALLIDDDQFAQTGYSFSCHTVLAIVLITAAGFVWDQRTPWTKFIDTTERPPDF